MARTCARRRKDVAYTEIICVMICSDLLPVIVSLTNLHVIVTLRDKQEWQTFRLQVYSPGLARWQEGTQFSLKASDLRLDWRLPWRTWIQHLKMKNDAIVYKGRGDRVSDRLKYCLESSPLRAKVMLEARHRIGMGAGMIAIFFQ